MSVYAIDTTKEEPIITHLGKSSRLEFKNPEPKSLPSELTSSSHFDLNPSIAPMIDSNTMDGTNGEIILSKDINLDAELVVESSPNNVIDSEMDILSNPVDINSKFRFVIYSS